MNIFVNGEFRELSDGLTLAELVAGLDIAAERIAVELNGNVVRRRDWNSVMIKDADRLEIVHFVGGG